MAKTISTFPYARFSYSRISFYCNLQKSYEDVICLGIVGEYVSDKVKGLALIARTALSEEDEARMGPLGAALLRKPFDYLWNEALNKWKAAPAGEGLSALSSYHATALCFEVSAEIAVPKKLIRPVRDAQITQFMVGEIQKKFEALVGNIRPKGEQARLEEAA